MEAPHDDVTSAHSRDDSIPMDGSSPAERLAFIITIDTEGDDLWSRPRDIHAHNAEVLPRFQELSERYGLKPTYLTNWEMANSGAFVELGMDVLRRGTAEIGMHLHAWNSPPLVALTDDDFLHQPYLIEYPEEQLREKVTVMTDTLEDVFGVKMLSHRAGRWGLDATYVRALIDNGYQVDCSVTPLIDWSSDSGDPNGRGGPDFTRFPVEAYFMDAMDIARPGSTQLLQVPMTIVPAYGAAWAQGMRAAARHVPYVRQAVARLLPSVSWLRPNGRNRDQLIGLLSTAREQRRDYVEFMLHSSELMPGGSPRFATERQVAALYDDLEALFEAASQQCSGVTLSEYRARYVSTRHQGT